MDTNIHEYVSYAVMPAKAGIQYRGYKNSYISNGTSAVLMTTVLDPRLRGDDIRIFATGF